MARSTRSLVRFPVSFEYPVVFTHDTFAGDATDLIDALTAQAPSRRPRVLFVAERAVAEAQPALAAKITTWAERHASRIELAGDVLVHEGGEACKADRARPLDLAADLDRLKMDRHAFLVIIGGGAFLDMAGFAAAITHRGIRVVRLPTTVLSQCDSGVGVKNGINAFGKKNFLGTFAPPWAVINDRDLLATLPVRDRIAGMAEAVKVALIRDARFYTWLRDHVAQLRSGEPGAVGELIERSAELHARHIATGGDPFELGAARPLDFGHWAAHKLESLSDFEVRHGEAVAIGIALDSFYSVEQGLLPRAALTDITATLDALGFHLWRDALDTPSADGRPAVLDGLQEFREHLGGELTVTMLEDVGRGVETHTIDEATMLRGLDWLRARSR